MCVRYFSIVQFADIIRFSKINNSFTERPLTDTLACRLLLFSFARYENRLGVILVNPRLREI